MLGDNSEKGGCASCDELRRINRVLAVWIEEITCAPASAEGLEVGPAWANRQLRQALIAQRALLQSIMSALGDLEYLEECLHRAEEVHTRLEELNRSRHSRLSDTIDEADESLSELLKALPRIEDLILIQHQALSASDALDAVERDPPKGLRLSSDFKDVGKKGPGRK